MTRIRQVARAVLVPGIAVLFGSLAMAPAASAQDAFDYQRRVTVPEPGWLRIRVTTDIAAKLRPGWPDMAVFDPEGVVLTHAILGAASRPDRISVGVGAVEEVPDGWRLTLVVGADKRPHRRLIFDFGNRAAVPGVLLEASGDGDAWHEIATANLYRLGNAPGFQQSAIAYPATRERFLRLTWPAAAGLPELESIQVELVPEGLTAPESVALRFQRQDTVADVVRIVVEPPKGGVAVSALALAVEPSVPVAYHLEVAAGAAWNPAAARMLAAWDTIPLPLGTFGGSLPVRLSVWSATGVPVTVTAVKAVVRPRYVAFDAPAPGTYALRYGSLTAGAAPDDVAAPGAAADTWPVVVPDPEEYLGEGSRLPEAVVGPGVAVDADAFDLRAPIHLVDDGSDPVAGGPRLARLSLPPGAYAATHSRLQDVRVAFAGRQVPYVSRVAAVPDLVLAAFDLSPQDRGDGTSALEVTLPAESLPLTAVELAVPAVPFRRVVAREIVREVRPGEESEAVRVGAQQWRCPGRILVPGAPEPRCRLTVNPGSVRGRRLRLVFDDGDNPPLRHMQVMVWRSRDEIVFPWPAAADADPVDEAVPVLLVGNSEARAPRYDLDSLAGALLTAPTSAAEVALEEAAGPGGTVPGGPEPSGLERYAFLAAVAVASLALLAVLRSQVLKDPDS